MLLFSGGGRTAVPTSRILGRSFSTWKPAPATAPALHWRHLRLTTPAAATVTSGCIAGAPLFACRRLQSSSANADGKNLYTVLGVASDATQEEIKASYKKLALQFHPDRNSDPGAEEKFKTISAAYSIIGNREKRRDYDAEMAMSRRMGNSDRGGGGEMGSAYGSPWEGGRQQGQYTYQQMSKEEADRLFRDLFGGMRVDQIFRNFEEEMRRGGIRSGSGLGSTVGHNFQSDEQVFRPFFRQEGSTTNIYVDGHGNRMEETSYTDPRGKQFTVRRTTSADPNASTNQTAEDFYRGRSAGKDGRYHFGNASSEFKKPNFDFTENMFGVRSHGRHPLIAFLLLGAWTVVLGTLFFCFLHFLFHHPFFSTAILLLMILGRKSRRFY